MVVYLMKYIIKYSITFFRNMDCFDMMITMTELKNCKPNIIPLENNGITPVKNK